MDDPTLAHSPTNRERRLQLLCEAAAVLLTADDPDSMLHRLFEKISADLNVDTYFNFMVEPSRKRLRLMSCSGIEPAQAESIRTLEFGQAICGTVALERHPIIATHIQTSGYDKADTVRAYGIRAYACNPLLAGPDLLGTLSFATRNRDEFDPDEIEFIQTITRYVTAAYERLQLIERLKAADRRKDEFLATVSHELRTPLASGYGWAQFLEAEPDDPDILSTGLRAIRESFKAQIAVVDDLLDLSRIAAGKLELDFDAIDLSEVVHGAAEEIRDAAARKRITLSVSLQPRIGIRGDADRLRQVVTNLASNAVKFTPEGGEVGIELKEHAEGAELVVRDNGAGIDATFLPHVFEPFRQADGSISRMHGGLGVGLSIVSSVVAGHGGRVEASSEGQGRGSTFTVRLPISGTVHEEPQERSGAPLHLVRRRASR